jgi:hypothetical protein
MYTLKGPSMLNAEHGHTLEFLRNELPHGRTASNAPYSVDAYTCRCGAEVQVASSSKVGIWANRKATEPCGHEDKR